MGARNDSHTRPRRGLVVYVIEHALAALFQVLFAASLWRVRVRIDVVLEFVLADVRGRDSE
jgi:hypothetical protein